MSTQPATPVLSPEPVGPATAAAVDSTQFASWDPSEDQMVAHRGVLAWWADKNRKLVLSMGGLAGSGKTSLVGHLARELIDGSSVSVAFATYTGKASQVLATSLSRARVSPDYVGTIHRLMYRPVVDESTGRVLGWQRQDKLHYDLIVIDEASMVPTDILDDLKSYGIPILAVGDHGQLPPVGEDASLMLDPDFRLETIHRQARGNPIIQLAHLIREGAAMRKVCEFANSDPTGKLAWFTGTDGLYEAVDWGAPPGMVISFTNRTRSAMNKLARRFLKRTGRPVVGEVVLCVRNAYLDHGLFANGTRAVVTEIDEVADEKAEEHYHLTLDTGDREPFRVKASRHQFGHSTTFKEYNEVPGGPWFRWEDVGVLLDFGYSLTAHKSQGSQSNSVAVLFERTLSVLEPDEFKRWGYTACSRASDRLMLVTDV